MKRRKLVILPRLYDANGDVSKSWFVHYSYRNPKTGKMKRFRVYGELNNLKTPLARNNAANKIIEEFTTKIKRGWTPFDVEEVIYDDLIQYANVADIYGQKRRNNLVLKIYMNEYLKRQKTLVSAKSFESYQSKIRLFSQWLDREGMGENDISSITPEVINRFFDYLIHERKLQGRTIEKYGVNLKSLFNDLIERKKIFESPMPPIPKVLNTVDHSAKPIQLDDMERLKNHIQSRDPQLWLAIQFEFYCFIRPGTELRLLKIENIDFHMGTITIPKDKAKNRREQTIGIPNQFLSVLKHQFYLDKFDKSFYVFGSNRVPGEKPLGKNTLRTRFNRFRDALGLSKAYKFYSWKHTGAIHASNAGIPVKDIQMQMRHHSLDITDKYLTKMKGSDSVHIKNNFPTL
ncbi:site-specific integrase [Labilibacter sediminis]|nr:site-specific integrase [Labilibacter sediminis]